MPQIQILPESPSFGSELGKALSTGFSRGVSAGLQQYLNNFQQQQKRRDDSLNKLDKSFKFYKDQFGYGDILPNQAREIYDNARRLIEEGGFRQDEAVQQAFDTYKFDRDQGAASEDKEDMISKIRKMPASSLFGISGAIPQAAEAIKSAFRPPEERAPAKARENIPALLREAEEMGPQFYNRFLSTLSNEEAMSLPREKRIEISQQLGRETIPQEVERTLARGILGRGGADRIAELAGLPDTEFAPPGGQVLGETTGRLLRDLGLFGMAGAAPTVPGKALAAGSLFGGAAAAEQALAGETPTVGSVAPSALIGAGSELAAPLIGRLFRFLANKLPIARGEALKTAEAVTETAKPPKIRAIEFKPGEVPPSPPIGPQNAKEAQSLYNDIVNEAVKNLGERGITLEAINAGDKSAINELTKEASKVADLYKQAEKMNLKEFHRQRNELLKKLPQSPLEKYYAPPKEVSRTPETIAKEAERIKPLETAIRQNERRARDLQYQILSADQELRSGKFTAAEIERIRSARELNALAHKRAMDAIFDAKFEIKYGRPPATMEEISKQIETTFDKLRQGIKDPTVKKVQDFKKGFDRDKALIDEANLLADRGTLPGPEVFDEYLKIHREYLKAYDSLIEEVKNYIKENKGRPRFKSKVENAENLLKVVEDTKKLGEAKVTLQEDKRKALKHLEKPSGAFLKNALRDTRKDIDAFQKDLFNWHKIAEGREKLASEVAKERIKPIPEVAKKITPEPKKSPVVTVEQVKEAENAARQAAKDPTGPKVKSAAERSGMSQHEYQDYINRISERMSRAEGEIKAGIASPQTEAGILKDLLGVYKKLPALQKALAGGVVLGTIQGGLEEYMGYKPTQAEVGIAAAIIADPKNLGRRGIGTGTIAAITYRFIHKGFDKAAAAELKKRRSNPNSYNAYLRNLKEKYGEARANRIRKEAIKS